MSHRTFSLLMLFVAALAATGVLLALLVSLLGRSPASSPWLVPAIAFVCQVVMLFLGRRYILPPELAGAPARAALLVTVAVAGTMTVAFAGLWLLRAVAGGYVAAPVAGLVIWFVLLWLVCKKQNWDRVVKTRAR